jgi:hypothetical protein
VGGSASLFRRRSSAVSSIRVGTSSGLGKGRIILLGQSPSPEKVYYGGLF